MKAVTVTWTEIKRNHHQGYFNCYIKKRLKRILRNKKKLIILVPGHKSGDTNGCKTKWPQDIGSKLRRFEINTVTVTICWNAIGHGIYQQEGLNKIETERLPSLGFVKLLKETFAINF